MNTATIATDPAPTQRYRILRPDSIYVQWSRALAKRSATMPEPEVAPPLSPSPTEGASGWPSPAVILRHVAGEYGLSVDGLQGRKRDPYTVEGKRMAIHLLAASGLGPTAIGRVMHLDHSTILHHLRHVTLDPAQRRLLADLERELHHLAASTTRGA